MAPIPNQTAQQIDPRSTLGQGIPTQTPDSVAAIPNMVTPNPTSSVPPVPTIAPTLGQQGPSGPQAMPPTPNAPTTPTPTPTPHEMHRSLYQRALSILAPPTRYLDAQGNPQQTRPSLSNSILSGAIAGLLTPTTYRQGTFGPIADTQQTAANAFAAGKQQRQEQDDKVQKQVDDMQARKLQTVANNTAAMHSYASMMQAQAAAEKEGAEAEAAQTKNWQSIADQNQATIIASADEYDNNRSNPDAPRARLASSMTMDELLASPFKDKMTSQLMVQDGTRNVYDPATRRSHVVPTWTVLNPDIKFKLNQAAVERAARINPSFGNNLFDTSGGDVRMSLGRYASVMHQVISVDHAEDLLQTVADSKDPDLMKLGIRGNVEGRLAGVVRNDPSALKSLMEFENAGAAGGDTAAKMNRLLQSGGGDAIFKALGTDRDAVQNYVDTISNRKLSAQQLAKEGGMGDKAPAAPEQIKGLVDSIRTNPDLTDSDRKLLLNDVPAANKDGVVNMTQGQVKSLVTRTDIAVATNKNNNQKAALANGDPATVQKMASDIIEGDVGATSKLSSMRGNARQNTINGIHDEAARRGLDTTQFSPSAMDAKDEMWKDFHENKGTGLNRTAFDTFLGHANDALDASDVWKRANSPLINKPMSWLAKNVSDDPTYTKFAAALEPVRTEFMSFLKNNRAEHSEDIDTMQSVLNDKQTPAQIEASLQQLAKSADIRLAAIGAQYLSTMGTTYPNLVSDKGKAALQRFGIKAESPALSQNLPRGWANGQAQKLTNPNIAKQFVLAAGGNNAKAAEIAKQNGWSF